VRLALTGLAVTVVSGSIFLYLIPDNPTRVRFLNERQRYVAVERLRTNQAGLENKVFKWSQAMEALTDFRCLIMVPLAFLTVIPNACVSTFSPIVLKGLGYSSIRVLVMTIPQGVTCKFGGV
jgi:ACS family allantoate permease-like MFS transporter